MRMCTLQEKLRERERESAAAAIAAAEADATARVEKVKGEVTRSCIREPLQWRLFFRSPLLLKALAVAITSNHTDCTPCATSVEYTINTHAH
jgi:hypothetical protein